MRASEVAYGDITLDDLKRLDYHITSVQNCPDCHIEDKWDVKHCDTHAKDYYSVAMHMIDDSKLDDGYEHPYWDERIEEMRKPKKKEAVTMQELKETLKKEKITVEEHIQSVKNCIDCVGATVEKYDFLPARSRLCDHHRLELGFDRENLQAWKDLCRIANPNGDYQDTNPYYIERGESNKPASTWMDTPTRDFPIPTLKCLDVVREDGSIFVLEWKEGRDAWKVSAFRSSMYGTFVRDSRR